MSHATTFHHVSFHVARYGHCIHMQHLHRSFCHPRSVCLQRPTTRWLHRQQSWLETGDFHSHSSDISGRKNRRSHFLHYICGFSGSGHQSQSSQIRPRLRRDTCGDLFLALGRAARHTPHATRNSDIRRNIHRGRSHQERYGPVNIKCDCSNCCCAARTQRKLMAYENRGWHSET